MLGVGQKSKNAMLNIVNTSKLINLPPLLLTTACSVLCAAKSVSVFVFHAGHPLVSRLAKTVSIDLTPVV